VHVFYLLISSKIDRTTFPTGRTWCLYWQTVPPTRHEEFILCREWFLLTPLDYLPSSRCRHGRNGLSNDNDDDNDDEEDDDDDDVDHHDHANDDYSKDDDDDEEDNNNDKENDEDHNNDDDDDDDNDEDDDDDDDVSLYSVSTASLEIFCGYIQCNGHILVPSRENDPNPNKEDDVYSISTVDFEDFRQFLQHNSRANHDEDKDDEDDEDNGDDGDDGVDEDD
jgi:hypothetical protein